MASKLWSILVSTYYISYLIVVLPFFLIYFGSINSYRRGRNKRKVRRILKKNNIPKDLRREVTKSYKKSLKMFTIWNLAKNQNFIGGSKKDSDKSSFKITIN